MTTTNMGSLLCCHHITPRKHDYRIQASACVSSFEAAAPYSSNPDPPLLRRHDLPSGPRKLNLQTRSVVMLDRIDNSELLRAASLGAFGVVSIKAAAEDLLACVRAVASGVVWIQSEISHYATAATNAAAIAGTSGLDSLTVQQRKIAELVAVGMRNKHIANELAI